MAVPSIQRTRVHLVVFGICAGPDVEVTKGLDEVVDHVERLGALSALVSPVLVIHTYHTITTAISIDHE